MGRTDVATDLAPTGTLRASINLANPILAYDTPAGPGGVTVDIARAVADRLRLPLELSGFDSALSSFEALAYEHADLGFLAVEPAREVAVSFTAPYVLIEGVFVVRQDSTLSSPADVDQPGVRIAVKRGSAYDLFLSRSLQHAELVRGAKNTEVFFEAELEVVAGIRQPMTALVQEHPSLRIIDPRFMRIEQAVCTPKSRRPETIAFLSTLVEELKACGFIENSLRRSGQSSALVAPSAKQ